ncbi:hypothetical protein [Nostoc sp. NMS4]|uniref:hypothetical protein n=1 Tax=Nostoc sp. NMS4 TaxID=2815390 RepID=UPI0025DF75F4|nr:hypothetical protein [Nostoc sp. NMS4]MBN3922219.1 hypothetical protein [Nostoc sp. NMS4]
MYDATGKEVNNCKVSAQELPEFQSVYLSNISSVIDGDGLAALAVYYIASNTKLANVGATTVLSSAEGFYEHMGMAPSDVELDEWVGDTETVKTKALASLENKWQEF